ncbi:MKRN2 opposite strand protein [Nymphon striatum]|nr:MKRN2 opposite strand protein [Nymphon striatum]
MSRQFDDPGLFCFQHCQKNAKVFCFKLPSSCVICGVDLQTSELRIPPFRVPYPFTDASRAPCSVVIKPTNGDFLHNYKNSADLHMGVTDSNGIVYEYDEKGLKKCRDCGDSSEWKQCLAINVTDGSNKQFSAEWKEYWNFILNIIAEDEMWTSEQYKEETHNCYTFVLTFLRSLQLRNLNGSILSRTEFCKKFVLPRTTSAAKYISLYRHLLKNNIYIQQ